MKLNTGETVIISGREDGIHREGVAIMMSKLAESALMEWRPVNERIITARYYSKFIKLTIMHIYAPTMDATEEANDAFYEQLQATVEKANKHDMVLITGDMNAKVGSSNKDQESVMGRHGTGRLNSNGQRLIDFCGLYKYVICLSLICVLTSWWSLATSAPRITLVSLTEDLYLWLTRT